MMELMLVVIVTLLDLGMKETPTSFLTGLPGILLSDFYLFTFKPTKDELKKVY